MGDEDSLSVAMGRHAARRAEVQRLRPAPQEPAARDRPRSVLLPTGSALSKIEVPEPGDESDGPEILSCGCNGSGWIREADGGAGTARRCSCFTQRATEEKMRSWDERLRQARIMNYGIGARHQHSRVDNFRTSAAKPEDQAMLVSAKTKAQAYVDGFLQLRQDSAEFSESGMLLVGAPGCGKTHLAIGVMRSLASRYPLRVLALDFTHFLKEIRQTYNREEQMSTSLLLDLASDADLLVLDELGAQKPSDHTLEVLYLVLNSRYTRRLPSLFTTNYRLDPGRPGAIDPWSLETRISPPLVSRLYEMAHIVQFPETDYRREVRRHTTNPMLGS